METCIQTILLTAADSSSGEEQGPAKVKKQLPYKKKLMLPGPSKTNPIQIAQPDTGGEGYRVVLFNDDVHIFIEVQLQLMKALECSADHAEEITLRAHNTGRAVVTIASRSEAARVAGVLREIALSVTVDKV